jgi:hypothetical protein
MSADDQDGAINTFTETPGPVQIPKQMEHPAVVSVAEHLGQVFSSSEEMH